MWVRLRNVEGKKKRILSFPPPWEPQTTISTSRTPDPFLLLRDPRLLINLPRSWLSHVKGIPEWRQLAPVTWKRLSLGLGPQSSLIWYPDLNFPLVILGASLVALKIKNLPTMEETWVLEDALGKGMATHSSILAWRIPWTEEPSRLQSMGPQRVGDDWGTENIWWDIILVVSFISSVYLS